MRRTARRLCIAAGCLCVALSATTFASNVAASLPPDPSRKQTPLDHAPMATMLSLMGTTMKILPVYQNLNGQPLDGNWIVWAGRRKGFSL